MKNIVIDSGNSRIKIGVFDSGTLVKTFVFDEPSEILPLISQSHDNVIVSSVKGDAGEILSHSRAANHKIELKSDTSLPIKIRYTTPKTLGVDRIADACGAIELFPNQDSLVIDLGTCINYELVDKDNYYWGGIISPGVNMRFKSMNTFTAQLPLAEAAHEPDLIGESTKACLQSGVMNGVLEEIKGIISRIKIKYPDVRVILTGGDHRFFENQLKDSIFAAPELALFGLNRILIHNASN